MKGRERSRWIVAAGLLLFYPLARSRIPPRACLQTGALFFLREQAIIRICREIRARD